MVELLAPGVYTIETSFRARSIQGVSTSTTGFVGLARSGPVDGPPVLVTSFAEFERIFGGLAPLSIGTGEGAEAMTNYAAFAVRAFFNEQGARLYFARAHAPADTAAPSGYAAAVLHAAGGGGDPRRLAIRARFPGSAGNGTLEIAEALVPATEAALLRAPLHSLARSRASAATPATLRAVAPPAPLAAGAELRVALDGAAPVTLTFAAAPASVAAQAPLALPVTLAAQTDLVVTVDGVRQTIPLTGPFATAAALRNAINAVLTGARASIAGGTLAFETDAAGSAVSITVERFDALGFTDDLSTGVGTGVSRLDRVTAADVNGLLDAAGLAGVRASAPTGGALVLATVATGAARQLSLAGTAPAVLTALGFEPGATAASGRDGTAAAVFVRVGPAADGWHRFTRDGATGRWQTAGIAEDPAPALADGGQIVLVNLTYTNADGVATGYEEMSVAAGHPRYLGRRMRSPAAGAEAPLAEPLVLEAAGLNPAEFLALLFADAAPGATGARSRRLPLGGGDDGALPALAVWEAALDRLKRYDDIAIVAAPGSSAYPLVQRAMRAALIAHAETSGFRIAVLDPPPGQSLDALRTTRGEIDSSYAALYAPWIRIANPLARPGDMSAPAELHVPPSGHVAGIYARNDQLRGVHKTPANEVIRTALGFETDYNQAQQGVLNPLGINCLRTLAGRGNRIYGGRLATSDREIVYVSDRRYLNFVKRSIYESMQWAVFEPNGPLLWAAVREAVASFLYNQWFNGALFGTTTDEAYFVVCDGSVMTQADIDNGRLVCEIGLALLKPAEFVVFRIGQKTADMRR